MTVIMHEHAIWIAGKPRDILRILAALSKSHATLGDLLSPPDRR
ncbi:MAG: hypothetical protein ACM3X3_08145 [Betaproteobacteria bacterium]